MVYNLFLLNSVMQSKNNLASIMVFEVNFYI